ncbi:MAG: radical SAM protein [bacterium]
MSKKPQLTLIQPPILEEKYPGVPFRFDPLSLLVIASLTPWEDFDVRIIDDSFACSLDTNIDLNSALVGITVVNVGASAAYELAHIYREHGIPVILGGAHVTMNPEDAAPHADCIVIGEVENEWGNILADFRAGKLKSVYHCAPPNPINITIDRDFIPDYKNEYPLLSAIQTTRGCPNRCEFCAPAMIYGQQIRHRPVADVVAELKTLKARYGRDVIGFTDDNISGDRAYLRELLTALIPLKIHWASQMCLDVARDEELLDLIQRSGCFCAFIGLESVNQATLREINKNLDIDEIPQLLARFRDRRIMVIGSFSIGHDQDDEHVFADTLAFCHKNDIEFPLFVPLTAYKGLRLYNRLEGEDRLQGTPEDDPITGMPFQPRHVTFEELSARVAQMYRDYYTVGHLAKTFLRNIVKGEWWKIGYMAAFTRRYHKNFSKLLDKSGLWKC